MLVHNLAPPCALSVEVADYLSTLLAYVKEFFLLRYLRVHPVTLGLPLLALSEKNTDSHGFVAAIYAIRVTCLASLFICCSLCSLSRSRPSSSRRSSRCSSVSTASSTALTAARTPAVTASSELTTPAISGVRGQATAGEDDRPRTVTSRSGELGLVLRLARSTDLSMDHVTPSTLSSKLSPVPPLGYWWASKCLPGMMAQI